MEVKLKYVIEEIDRYGNVRRYYRKKPNPRIRLMGEPGTPEFMQAYHLARQGRSADPKKANQPPRIAAPETGTLRSIIVAYYRSPEFTKLDERTQTVRRGILDKLCKAGGADGKKPYGQRSVSGMMARHIRAIRDENADRPEAANGIVKALRQVFTYAIAAELPGVKFNPARDVPYFSSDGDGFHAWSLAEVEQFEKRHPIGSRARLALAALLYTCQRRSDVVTFGEPMVTVEPALVELPNGEIDIDPKVEVEWLNFRQFKGRKRKPVDLSIPVVQPLREIIEATPGAKDGEAWLLTEFGKPFTAAGFGNWFADRCVEAGVPGRAHGLRKAAAARLAELGCSNQQIKAITGHTTDKEVARYTRSARQKILAASAMGRMERDYSRRNGRHLKVVSGRTAA